MFFLNIPLIVNPLIGQVGSRHLCFYSNTCQSIACLVSLRIASALIFAILVFGEQLDWYSLWNCRHYLVGAEVTPCQAYFYLGSLDISNVQFQRVILYLFSDSQSIRVNTYKWTSLIYSQCHTTCNQRIRSIKHNPLPTSCPTRLEVQEDGSEWDVDIVDSGQRGSAPLKYNILQVPTQLPTFQCCAMNFIY